MKTQPGSLSRTDRIVGYTIVCLVVVALSFLVNCAFWYMVSESKDIDWEACFATTALTIFAVTVCSWERIKQWKRESTISLV